MIAGAQLAPSLARRFDDTVIMAAGLGVSAVGFALLTQVDAHSLPLLVASYFTMSLGVGPLTAICPGLIVGTAPPERAGAAASLSSTSAEFGGALGLAMLGSLGVAVYRVALAMPPGLSAGAAHRRTTRSVPPSKRPRTFRRSPEPAWWRRHAMPSRPHSWWSPPSARSWS